MTTTSASDRAAMERLAYWLGCPSESWAEEDGRVVFAVTVDRMETPEDIDHLIDPFAVAVTLTVEFDGRITIREFDAESWYDEEDRLCSIAVKREEAEDAEAEDQEGEE